MERSHLETRLIIEENIRRTHPRKERLWESKNNVLGLTTEDGGSYYWI